MFKEATDQSAEAQSTMLERDSQRLPFMMLVSGVRGIQGLQERSSDDQDRKGTVSCSG